jgi:hypothetical protein
MHHDHRQKVTAPKGYCGNGEFRFSGALQETQQKTRWNSSLVVIFDDE